MQQSYFSRFFTYTLLLTAGLFAGNLVAQDGIFPRPRNVCKAPPANSRYFPANANEAPVVTGENDTNNPETNRRTELYIDGVRVTGNQSLPQQAIEQLQVITGGTPGEYGDVIQGVVQIDEDSENMAEDIEFDQNIEHVWNGPDYRGPILVDPYPQLQKNPYHFEPEPQQVYMIVSNDIDDIALVELETLPTTIYWDETLAVEIKEQTEILPVDTDETLDAIESLSHSIDRCECLPVSEFVQITEIEIDLLRVNEVDLPTVSETAKTEDDKGHDIVFAPEMTVFPNPTADFLNVRHNFTATTTLLVTDMHGQIVLQNDNLEAGKTTLDLQQLAAGNYVVLLTDGTNKMSKQVLKY